jgi:cellulose biosynthesis protein BcsQ
MRTLAVYNIKGGVGKTATAVNLAYLAAASGQRTLLWDLDPQGAASFYFRVRAKVRGGARRLLKEKDELDGKIRGSDFDNLDILPADFSYRNLDLELAATKKPTRRLARILKPLRRNYDLLIIDCAPSISLVSEGVFEATDALLIPTIPTPLSLNALAQLTRHLRRADSRLRLIPFFCMVDRRKALHRRVCDDGRRDNVGFAKTTIPYSSHVEQMGIHRAPLTETSPRSPVSRAYSQLWSEVRDRLDAPVTSRPPAPKKVRRLIDAGRPGTGRDSEEK